MKCPKKRLVGGWREVVFAADCDPETGLCPCERDCCEECLCPGPTEEEIEYRELRGVLYRKRSKPCSS
jgi:hypothetical protein